MVGGRGVECVSGVRERSGVCEWWEGEGEGWSV